MDEKITIRQLRLMREATQQELADMLDITLQAYRDKEMGKTRFYFDEVVMICEKLHFDFTKINCNFFEQKVRN